MMCRIFISFGFEARTPIGSLIGMWFWRPGCDGCNRLFGLFFALEGSRLRADELEKGEPRDGSRRAASCPESEALRAFPGRKVTCM
jgi:hypothetical protein